MRDGAKSVMLTGKGGVHMDNEKLGAVLRALRRELGLTQRQAAERLGVTDKAVSKWERGLSYT